MKTALQMTVVMIFALASALWLPIAHCEEIISKLPDGRYLVQMKNVTVALPEEDPKNKRILFYVATPPGTDPFSFYLTDLVRDPDDYAPRLRRSDWSSVSAQVFRPGELLGEQIARGVIGVGIHVGADKNCEMWQPNWARYREAAIGLSTDQYGWTRQDNLKSPRTSMFIKFLDEGDRAKSRYYPLYCDFTGNCSLTACHGDLTARISIYSFNKPKGEDYVVKDFDQQIASGIKVLERMLVNNAVDLSHP